MTKDEITANTEAAPDGVLILDKPAGMTSHDCVARIRRLYNTKKVGHTGTLDPMATGVLPILIGRAAKASEYLTAEEKGYEAILRIGIVTDTEDTTGQILSRAEVLPSADEVYLAAASFLGEYEQIPPMYSALKVDGKKLCDLARSGITVERKARTVFLRALTCTSIPGSKTDYRLSVRCSKGTYIRTLCADIGARLGCGAVMAELRRTRSGSFTISDAHTLTAIEELSPDQRTALLAPTESLFSDLTGIFLPAFFERLADNGQPVYLHKLKNGAALTALPVGTVVRMEGETKGFFALGTIRLCGEDARPAACPTKKFKL